MSKVRRGNYVFLSWKGDHSPRHVHVYKDGELIVKWNLEAGAPMKGHGSAACAHREIEEGRRNMKLRRATVNNRKKQLELTARSGRTLPVPFAKLDPRPSRANPIREAYVDKELGSEAVTYVLESGEEGSVHVDHALEYNEDPSYLAELLTHQLTVEARRRLDRSELSRREVARRLGTSVPQLYRLLDPTNTRKSLRQLISLLHVLDCEVQLVVNPRDAA